MDEKQKQQFQRLLEEKERAAAASADAHESKLTDTDEAQDSYSVRQKSTGHKKKTADKWNQ
jgi:hypothetical protein